MTSCLLFHGPGALQSALDEAGRTGRLLAPSFGANGIKVDEAREFVGLMLSPPIGLDIGVVMAGPMDLAPPKSADVLLKVIEEFTEGMVHPILWANDLGGVRPTVRSRCLDTWCPATGLEEPDEELDVTARELLAASRSGQIWLVPTLVAKMGPKKQGVVKLPDRYSELLGEVADAIAANIDEQGLALWERIRAVARWQNPTQIEVITAFLPDVS